MEVLVVELLEMTSQTMQVELEQPIKDSTEVRVKLALLTLVVAVVELVRLERLGLLLAMVATV
jgi:hypothetical protein